MLNTLLYENSNASTRARFGINLLIMFTLIKLTMQLNELIVVLYQFGVCFRQLVVRWKVIVKDRKRPKRT